MAMGALVLLVSCGNATAAADGEGAAAAGSSSSSPAPGCDGSVAAIHESDQFIPYESRISHNPFSDDLGLTPTQPEAVGALDMPRLLAGVAAVAARNDLGGTVVGYGDPKIASLGRSAFLKQGGLLFTRTKAQSGRDEAQALFNDADSAGRINLVAVGPNTAAVSWSDPDASGLRTHHVIWTAAEYDFNLEASMTPEQLVSVARSAVC